MLPCERNVTMCETNIKIAEWMGWTDIHISQQDLHMFAKMDPTDSSRYRVNGDFDLCDSHAIAILPKLVENGYIPNLLFNEVTERWECGVVPKKHATSSAVIINGIGASIHAAISNLVVEVIRYERNSI
jgi:hypothetical protein